MAPAVAWIVSNLWIGLRLSAGFAESMLQRLQDRVQQDHETKLAFYNYQQFATHPERVSAKFQDEAGGVVTAYGDGDVQCFCQAQSKRV
jgi:hypothetical protein